MTKLIEAVKDAMHELSNMPCGAIGKGGPTLEEMDKYVDETGQSWEGDAEYHTAQRAWRILEEGLKL